MANTDPDYLAELEKESEFLNQKSRRGNDRIVLKDVGESILFRIVPYVFDEKGRWYARIARHWIGNKPYLCTKDTDIAHGGDVDGRCDICDLVDKFNRDRNQTISRIAYKMTAVPQYLTFAVPIEHVSANGQSTVFKGSDLKKAKELWLYKEAFQDIFTMFKTYMRRTDAKLSIIDPIKGCDIWMTKSRRGVRFDRAEPLPLAPSKADPDEFLEAVLKSITWKADSPVTGDDLDDLLLKIEDICLDRRSSGRDDDRRGGGRDDDRRGGGSGRRDFDEEDRRGGGRDDDRRGGRSDDRGGRGDDRATRSDDRGSRSDDRRTESRSDDRGDDRRSDERTRSDSPRARSDDRGDDRRTDSRRDDRSDDRRGTSTGGGDDRRSDDRGGRTESRSESRSDDRGRSDDRRSSSRSEDRHHDLEADDRRGGGRDVDEEEDHRPRGVREDDEPSSSRREDDEPPAMSGRVTGSSRQISPPPAAVTGAPRSTGREEKDDDDDGLPEDDKDKAPATPPAEGEVAAAPAKTDAKPADTPARQASSSLTSSIRDRVRNHDKNQSK